MAWTEATRRTCGRDDDDDDEEYVRDSGVPVVDMARRGVILRADELGVGSRRAEEEEEQDEELTVGVSNGSTVVVLVVVMTGSPSLFRCVQAISVVVVVPSPLSIVRDVWMLRLLELKDVWLACSKSEQ